jgi:phosphoribosylformimino-5-aminoimidazole carboxamide ribotide isomerase
MHLLPAIDIRDGHCVRLLQGDFGMESRYDVRPTDLAKHYAQLGADWLHVVDLDGAARGEPVNLALIREMQSAAGIHIQLGGGVRNRESLAQTLDVAQRVVIGSLAVTDPSLVEAWLKEFGEQRLTLALDVRIDKNNVPYLTTHGWQRESQITLWDALSRFHSSGVVHVLCTDVSKDGALVGPNFELYRECVQRWPTIEFQASGGVRGVDDLSALASAGVPRAVSGKALLEGKLTEKEISSFLQNA